MDPHKPNNDDKPIIPIDAGHDGDTTEGALFPVQQRARDMTVDVKRKMEEKMQPGAVIAPEPQGSPTPRPGFDPIDEEERIRLQDIGWRATINEKGEIRDSIGGTITDESLRDEYGKTPEEIAAIREWIADFKARKLTAWYASLEKSKKEGSGESE